jgi:hypothetical protein
MPYKGGELASRVTLDSFGYKHIDLFYYGKPMMPTMG